MRKNSLYTRNGDEGLTRLVGGIQVKKTDPRIEAYGTVDELNAHIGLLLSEMKSDEDIALLEQVQNDLFVVGSYLATDQSKTALNPACILPLSEVDLLEHAIDAIEDSVPPQTSFILPGGCRESSLSHVCRTVCRRAERCVLTVHEDEAISKEILKFMNRLSDYLFALSRKLNFIAGREEKIWKKTCR